MQSQHVVTITLEGQEVRRVREALWEVLLMTAGENFRSDPSVLHDLYGRLAYSVLDPGVDTAWPPFAPGVTAPSPA
jgi:hypothetical protein